MSLLFALDSSGKAAGACALRSGVPVAEAHLNAGRTHSETLLPLVQRVFASAGATPAEVTRWAVTAGPGSFTGLRIGLALVKGLAVPGGAPVVPVSTLRAVAAASGLAGTVVAALDARRNEVYWAAFACRDGQVHRLTPDAAGPAENLRPMVEQLPGPVFFVGDGAEICYNSNTYGPVVRPGPLPAPLPMARAAALCAFAAPPAAALPASQVRPRYLRLSQAERERAARCAVAPGQL